MDNIYDMEERIEKEFEQVKDDFEVLQSLFEMVQEGSFSWLIEFEDVNNIFKRNVNVLTNKILAYITKLKE